MKPELPATVDEYISQCVPSVQTLLCQLRQTIMDAAPEATQKISWGMITFVFHGNLVHLSAEKKHIGFHPAPSAILEFQEELSDYRCSKGTIQLPLDKPLPLDLIRRIILFRTTEQRALYEAKQAGQTVKKELRPRCPMPADVSERLLQEGLTEHYNSRPPYQQNDYIGWIIKAKRPETRQKHLDQMLEELRSGDAYMGMAYRAKK